MTLESFIVRWIGDDLPVRIRAYDGTDVGPGDAATTVIIRTPDALMRMVTAPGELGFARAYVAGDLDIEGNIYDFLELRRLLPEIKLTPSKVAALMRLVGSRNLRRIPPPPEEHRGRGILHTRRRDASAVSYHYDVSNDFYRIVLGPSMTYSCAVFTAPSDTVVEAQANKHDLICRKLGLRPGMRLLDIGCGWGGMVVHAARHYGVRSVGVTLSRNQVDLAGRRIAEAGLTDVAEVRLEDYRDVRDGPFDAISSIGMFEHVGMKRLDTYLARTADLLVPGGRLLNHAISRSRSARHGRTRSTPFIDRYVFPDGEIQEVGSVISALQDRGLEVRHMENFREHYALTLRGWVENLESHWDDAVAEVGEGRAKVWRLYMAGSAVSFEDGRIHVDQVLAVNTPASGVSGLPLRPEWAEASSPANSR